MDKSYVDRIVRIIKEKSSYNSLSYKPSYNIKPEDLEEVAVAIVEEIKYSMGVDLASLQAKVKIYESLLTRLEISIFKDGKMGDGENEERVKQK